MHTHYNVTINCVLIKAEYNIDVHTCTQCCTCTCMFTLIHYSMDLHSGGLGATTVTRTLSSTTPTELVALTIKCP